MCVFCMSQFYFYVPANAYVPGPIKDMSMAIVEFISYANLALHLLYLEQLFCRWLRGKVGQAVEELFGDLEYFYLIMCCVGNFFGGERDANLATYVVHNAHELVVEVWLLVRDNLKSLLLVHVD